MKSLDKDTRLIVEKNIDALIRYPKKAEKMYRDGLKRQGIEPNLETILGSIVGYIEGLVDGFYTLRHGRALDDDERNELFELLHRRAFEIRQAFIGTRIE